MFRKIASAIAVLMILAGPAAAQLPDAAEPASASVAQVAGGHDVDSLGVGDKIRVVVFEEAALSGLFNVAANGDIAFPLVGPVKAAGLSPGQLESAIAGLLGNGYLKDPRVNVEVLTTRPYYILGEVTKPGEYPFPSGLTVIKAIAAAGGFSYRADQKRVLIKRMKDTAEHAEKLTPTTTLYPGDTIRITERFF